MQFATVSCIIRLTNFFIWKWCAAVRTSRFISTCKVWWTRWYFFTCRWVFGRSSLIIIIYRCLSYQNFHTSDYMTLTTYIPKTFERQITKTNVVIITATAVQMQYFRSRLFWQKFRSFDSDCCTVLVSSGLLPTLKLSGIVDGLKNVLLPIVTSAEFSTLMVSMLGLDEVIFSTISLENP